MSDYKEIAVPLNKVCDSCDMMDRVLIPICHGCSKTNYKKPEFFYVRIGENKMDRDKLKNITQKEMANRIAMYKPFTYWDITNEIRKFIKSEIDHSDVRSLCCEIFDDGIFPTLNEDWKVTLCTMKNKGKKVFVIHPSDVDPQEYVDEIVDPVDILDNLKIRSDLHAAIMDINKIFDVITDIQTCSLDNLIPQIVTINQTINDIKGSQYYVDWMNREMNGYND